MLRAMYLEQDKLGSGHLTAARDHDETLLRVRIRMLHSLARFTHFHASGGTATPLSPARTAAAADDEESAAPSIASTFRPPTGHSRLLAAPHAPRRRADTV